MSDRQARDYVKELERAALITTKQRGLRRTNVYLFLWTAELEQLSTSVPAGSDDPDDTPEGPVGLPVGRNSSSGLEGKNPAGPIGINSIGINSVESSSTSAACNFMPEEVKTKTPTPRKLVGDEETRAYRRLQTARGI